MLCRLLLIAVALMFTTTPARAQFPFPILGVIPVLDSGNLAQTILIAQRALDHLDELRSQHETVVELATGLGGLDAYRTPPIIAPVHDPGAWAYAAPWLQGLTSGDPTGSAYAAAAVALGRPDLPLELTPAARRAFETRYATVEITDSVASLGGHQIALARGQLSELAGAVAQLEADVTAHAPEYHQLTAILDKIPAGELIGRQQDQTTNQLLSHALEQLLARSKRQRDAEAAAINMQLTTWEYGAAANDAFAAGNGDALASWRQP